MELNVRTGSSGWKVFLWNSWRCLFIRRLREDSSVNTVAHFPSDSFYFLTNHAANVRGTHFWTDTWGFLSGPLYCPCEIIAALWKATWLSWIVWIWSNWNSIKIKESLKQLACLAHTLRSQEAWPKGSERHAGKHGPIYYGTDQSYLYGVCLPNYPTSLCTGILRAIVFSPFRSGHDGTLQGGGVESHTQGAKPRSAGLKLRELRETIWID